MNIVAHQDPQTVGFVDPTLMNRIAWSSRWASRQRSLSMAQCVLEQCPESPAKTDRLCFERGRALVTIAWQRKWGGAFDGAMKAALDVEMLLSEQDFPCERAHVYSILGVIYYSRNRLDLASSAVDRGLALVGPDVGRDAFVDLLTTRATIQRYHGNGSRAGLTIARARDLAEGADIARVEHNVARWMLADHEPKSARHHAERSLSLADDYQNRVILPYAWEVLGAAQVAIGDFDAASESFAKGLDIAVADEDRRAQCQIIERHAALELGRNELATACDLYRYGAGIAADLDYALWQRSFALGLAEAYERGGDLAAALAEHKRAWAIELARRT